LGERARRAWRHDAVQRQAEGLSRPEGTAEAGSGARTSAEPEANEAGGRIKNVKTAWETAVLRAHDVTPGRTRGKLSAENRAKLAEIDLNFHDLRHEAGKPQARSRLAVARGLGVARSYEA
jgi:hypothetical protein